MEVNIIKSTAIRMADIILNGSDSAPSKIIQEATGASISHAALCTQAGMLIEALGEGVVELKFRDSFNSDAGKVNLVIVLRRRGITPAQANDVVAHARSFARRPYDMIGAIGSGTMVKRGSILAKAGCVVAPLGCAIGEAKINENASEKNQDNAFFCSELVSRAFELAGVPLSDTRATWMNPRMIRVSTQLLYVGHLDLSEYQS